jgi:small nuclear ribonucleoprotein (snRNP)-like protein
VRVVTRHATGVRGVAFAYVKAFDRYVNLILQDVTESYTAGSFQWEGGAWLPPPTATAGFCFESAAAAWFPTLKTTSLTTTLNKTM